MKKSKWINIFLILMAILIYKFVNKDSLMYVINQSLPPREAGLLAGIMLGDKSGFDKDFYDSLKNSGLVHLVVASGSNVMLLVGGWIELMAKFLGRKRTIIVGLMGGWWYVNMVGWEIPVVRAMLLISIMYWAQLLGRKFNLWRGIVLGILIMIVGEPMVLKSVSFWLSIMAFVAVVTAKLKITNYELSPKRTRYTAQIKNEFIKNLFKISFDTLWVGVWITPILGLIFGKISLISPLANVLVIGLVELVMVAGIIGIALGGGIFLWLVYPGLKYLVVVAQWAGKFPIWEFRFNWWMLIGYYLILFYFLFRKYNRS